MKILIMRHGDAMLKYSSDKDRSLNSIGYNKSILIAKWLSKQIYKIDRSLISPYLRAIQTFQCLQKYLTLTQYEILSELSPSGNASKIYCYIQELIDKKINQILLISHLPLLINLINILCSNDKLIILPTAGIVCITTDTTNGKIIWQIKPQDLYLM